MNYNLLLSDIDRSQSGSLKRGIKTDRQTNPLDPLYKFPGDLELLKNNNPYGESLHEKKKPQHFKDTPGEIAIRERLQKIKINSMNNVIHGKIE